VNHHGPIDWHIQGERDAEALMQSIRSGCGDGDELSRYLVRTLPGKPSSWLRGFCREWQKSFERGRC
jgi:hypothetical protein